MTGRLASTPLFEREAEVEALEAALAAAEEERGGIVVVHGAAGLGKTSLLSLATSLAEARGFHVLTAAGQDLEEGLPWGVAVQLFGETAQDEEAERVFSGAAALARPLLERAAAPPSVAPTAADPFPLLHGLHWLAAGLSERRPLLLLVDDAHWSDPETLRFLNYLQVRIEELRALVVAATRPGERDDEVAEGLLARLRSHPGAVQLTPSPLSGRSVHRLVRHELPAAEDRFCDAIAAASRGNPFLARELAVAARHEGLEGTASSAGRLRELRPERIRNTILVRLAGRGREAVGVASATAVLGPSARFELVRRLAGIDEETAARAADTLAEAGMLVPGETLAFAHPIVRELVYADIAPQRRASDHRAAARLLHESGAPAEEVASQLISSAPVREPWAVSALREAAVRAAANGAAGSAARLLRRALDGMDEDDPELLHELGDLEAKLGDPAAVGHLEAAVRLAQSGERRGPILASLAGARYAAGDTEGVVDATRRALDEITPGRGGTVEAELLFNYGLTGRAVPPLVEDVARLMEHSRSAPDGRPTQSEVVRLMLAGFDALLRGDHRAADERLRQAGRHLADERLAREVPVLAQITLEEFRSVLGHTRDAERAATGYLEAARGRGSRLEAAIALEARAGARWFAGDLPGAEGDAELALSLSEATWDAATVVLRVIKGGVLVERGELDAAAEALDVPEAVEARLPGSWGWFWLPFARGRLELAHSNFSAARHQALMAGDRLLAIEAPTAGFVQWRAVASQAAAQLGARDEALALAREEVERARAGQGTAFTIGTALANLGSVEGGEAGLCALRESVELLEPSAGRLEHARALVELGAALRRAGWRRDARGSLREGLERARACEARALVDRAAEELRVAGGRPRRLALSGVESLTPGERRVAEMAAQGLANREIAEALFVTRRTVETHLTHAYNKLNISSRAELQAALRSDRSAN